MFFCFLLLLFPTWKVFSSLSVQKHIILLHSYRLIISVVNIFSFFPSLTIFLYPFPHTLFSLPRQKAQQNTIDGALFHCITLPFLLFTHYYSLLTHTGLAVNHYHLHYDKKVGVQGDSLYTRRLLFSWYHLTASSITLIYPTLLSPQSYSCSLPRSVSLFLSPDPLFVNLFMPITFLPLYSSNLNPFGRVVASLFIESNLFYTFSIFFIFFFAQCFTCTFIGFRSFFSIVFVCICLIWMHCKLVTLSFTYNFFFILYFFSLVFVRFSLCSLCTHFLIWICCQLSVLLDL